MNNIIKLCLFFFLLLSSAYADKNFAIIRDDEIESSIIELINPLLKVAGIPPDTITVNILNDKTLNAFIVNQNTIFLHSGLLVKFYDDPDLIMGVIAHELGHIKGGHLAKLSTRYNDIAKNALASSIILGAIGVAMSSPEIMMAGINGSMHIANRSMLSFSRQQEQIADKIAVELLEKSKNSPIGLKKIMDYFRKSEVGLYREINPYAITHPMPVERLQFITNYMVKTKYPSSMIVPNIRDKYVRSMIKLASFLEPNNKILASCNEADLIYAGAIIDFRNNKRDGAINKIDQLISKEPNNPYFYELKGQMLFENGLVLESLSSYKKAYALKASELISYEYAYAIIEAIDHSKLSAYKLDEAITILKKPNKKNELNIENLEQLARAYGKKGQVGIANYYLAKMYLELGDQKKATRFAKIAIKQIPKSDPLYLNVSEIIQDN